MMGIMEWLNDGKRRHGGLRCGGMLRSFPLLLIFVVAPYCAVEAQTAPAEARQVALEKLLGEVPSDLKRSSGSLVGFYKLNSIDDLARAKLGEPWSFYTLLSTDLTAAPIDSATLFAHALFVEYQFPIMIDGQCHGTVDVAERDGKWTAIGGSGGGDPTMDILADTTKCSSRIFILIRDKDIDFAFVRTATGLFAIPETPGSALDLGGSAGCEPIPFAHAMRALKDTISKRCFR
jgi:hypothetical protein